MIANMQAIVLNSNQWVSQPTVANIEELFLYELRLGTDWAD